MTKTTHIKKIAAALLALSMGAGAQAAGWYVGGGAGVSRFAPDPNNTGESVINDQDTAKKLYIGRDFSDRIAVEGYIADLGRAQVSNGEIGYQVGGVQGLYRVYQSEGYANKGQSGFAVFGKAGVGIMRNENTTVQYERDSEVHLSVGAGGEYKFANGFGVRGDVDLYDKDAVSATLSGVAHFGGAAAPVVTLPPAMSVRDSDGDGVLDNVDQCDGVPGPADNFGCPVQEVTPVYPPDCCEQPAPVSEALGRIYFALDSDKLNSQASSALDGLTNFLHQNPAVSVQLDGHTCAIASEVYNVGLSQRRVNSVKKYLQQHGIDPARLSLAWYGETQPAQTNSTAQGRQLNRRVEIYTR